MKVSKSQGNRSYIIKNNEVVGYGCEDLHVKKIDSWLARTIVRQNHYSKTIVNNSRINLGVFNQNNDIAGVLQYGYALNPSSGKNVVYGTGSKEYLELNRMWLHDSLLKNSESRAISYSMRYIKKAYKDVGWIQSFADERCKRSGVVYQAANFKYIGYHESKFYLLDNVWYHELCVTAKNRSGQRGVYLRKNIDRATVKMFKQYRYIYFINQKLERQLNTTRFKIQNYPK